MMTFYDYDMVCRGRAGVTYHLCADTKRMPIGGCVIRDCEFGGFWRTTWWRSKHGRRHTWFADLDAAMKAGIDWARRREKVG